MLQQWPVNHGHGSGLAVRLASITLAAVPAEELTYRSALLGLRLGTDRRPGAVAWSSALFGLSHVLPTLSTMSQTAAGRLAAAAFGRRGCTDCGACGA
jgi:membrane protease YdiL (CAAX protease family)